MGCGASSEVAKQQQHHQQADQISHQNDDELRKQNNIDEVNSLSPTKEKLENHNHIKPSASPATVEEQENQNQNQNQTAVRDLNNEQQRTLHRMIEENVTDEDDDEDRKNDENNNNSRVRDRRQQHDSSNDDDDDDNGINITSNNKTLPAVPLFDISFQLPQKRERQTIDWDDLSDKIPFEKNDAEQKVRRDKLFDQMIAATVDRVDEGTKKSNNSNSNNGNKSDNNVSNKLSLKNLIIGFVAHFGGASKVVNMPSVITAAFNAVKNKDLSLLHHWNTVVMASSQEENSSCEDNNVIADHYSVERKEFRLLLVCLRLYFEFYQLFEDQDTYSEDSSELRISIEEFKKAGPLLEKWGAKIGGGTNNNNNVGLVADHDDDELSFEKTFEEIFLKSNRTEDERDHENGKSKRVPFNAVAQWVMRQSVSAKLI